MVNSHDTVYKCRRAILNDHRIKELVMYHRITRKRLESVRYAYGLFYYIKTKFYINKISRVAFINIMRQY